MPAEDKDETGPYFTRGRETADAKPKDRKIVNMTDRGRYGEAEPDEPHLSPEIEPTRGKGAPARVPDAGEGGSFAHERAEKPDEPRDERD